MPKSSEVFCDYCPFSVLFDNEKTSYGNEKALAIGGFQFLCKTALLFYFINTSE